MTSISGSSPATPRRRTTRTFSPQVEKLKTVERARVACGVAEKRYKYWKDVALYVGAIAVIIAAELAVVMGMNWVREPLLFTVPAVLAVASALAVSRLSGARSLRNSARQYLETVRASAQAAVDN